ncbi:MAG: hypothetical protein K8U57_08700 [Planctomycetes bacterium]|nr:hypothetical protein [Planctomycetota bacterium]
MSTTWLHVQSFFADAGVLQAINDLSIMLKIQAASGDDSGWRDLGKQGREKLIRFLRRVVDLEIDDTGGVILGVDPRTQTLAHSLGHPDEAACGASPKVGLSRSPEAILQLLEANKPEERGELLESLNELYRVILAHQQQDADVIFQRQ